MKQFQNNVKVHLLKEKKRYKVVIRAAWIFLAGMIVAIPLFVYLVILNPLDLFGGMPGMTAVENPENDLSSEVISADGVSLGRYFTFNRSQVTYQQLPKHLVRTLIISEDHRFYDHSGLDFISYLRVVWGIITFNPQGGGSTLSQQTAKNLFSTREDELQGKLARLGKPFELLISKTKEWILAVRLERNLTKEEILTLYLNTVSFSSNAYGIKIASETYFRKPVRLLNLQECALLVGMLQNPALFNPVYYPKNALSKRNEVIDKLHRHQFFKTQQEADSLKALPVKLNFSVQNQNQGIATYFRSVLKAEMQQWCREHGYNLSESGLKIYTTIDSRMQRFAEEAMMGHMRKLQRDFDREWGKRDPWVDENGNPMKEFLDRKIERLPHYKQWVKKYGEDSDSVKILLNTKKRMRVFSWNGEHDTLFSTIDSLRYFNRFLNAGLVSMDPVTGAIKSWVGGINHRYFKFDHVAQAKRQPGSTFKVFVYAKAMEDEYSPCARFLDVSPSISIGNSVYHVRNSTGTYGDGNSYTLRQALAKSLNSVTMQLMDKLKPSNVADFANRVGIKSKLDPVYSLGLGTSDVSLFEMVGAYSSFVNLGMYTEPYYITRIEDRHGNVLATFDTSKKQVTNEETAYKTLYLLKGGVEEEGGSSRNISDQVTDNNDVGGKTGTTDNASDGWYIGVTHNLVTGVWVGGDERSIHFPSWAMGSGGRSALPIWDRYMQRVYTYRELGYPKGFFRQPAHGLQANFDCDSINAPDEFQLPGQ